MKSPLNIHPPKNWQDFETLCLKLWGEIWNIPHEIEFNSDNSQGQHGVDIYGPVNQGTAYNGIQCKNKKLNLIDGSPNRISISDIDQEIQKAVEFKPTLNKLIIATSLPKDQKIEEHIRIKSASHAQNGLFTIQICFWDFFERKLPEFPKVYDWYVKHEDFHQVSSLSVCFQGGATESIYHPKFQKNIDRYVKKDLEKEIGHNINAQSNLQQILGTDTSMNILQLRSMIHGQNRLKWEQYCWLNLRIQNTGQTAIEDFKVELEFQGDFEKVGPERKNYILNKHFQNDVKGYSNSKTDLYIEPFKRILVPGDDLCTGNFFIHLKPESSDEIKIIWKLLSKNFSDSGSLLVKVVPKYHVVINEYDVDSSKEEGEYLSYSVIERSGMIGLEGTNYFDRESDYSFE
jgi:hypothetical protein